MPESCWYLALLPLQPHLVLILPSHTITHRASKGSLCFLPLSFGSCYVSVPGIHFSPLWNSLSKLLLILQDPIQVIPDQWNLLCLPCKGIARGRMTTCQFRVGWVPKRDGALAMDRDQRNRSEVANSELLQSLFCLQKCFLCQAWVSIF